MFRISLNEIEVRLLDAYSGLRSALERLTSTSSVMWIVGTTCKLMGTGFYDQLRHSLQDIDRLRPDELETEEHWKAVVRRLSGKLANPRYSDGLSCEREILQAIVCDIIARAVFLRRRALRLPVFEYKALRGITVLMEDGTLSTIGIDPVLEYGRDEQVEDWAHAKVLSVDRGPVKRLALTRLP